MVSVSGLIISPAVTQRNVRVGLHFEPSVGILARKVDKLGLDIRSFKEPLKRAVKQVMIPSIRTNFAVGGRPGWEPLAESTILRRKGSSKPLVRSGKLSKTMQQLNIWDIDKEKAIILDLPGSIWYGKVHQAGYGSGTSSTGYTGGSLNIGLGKRGSPKTRRGLYGNVGQAESGRSVNVPQRRFVMVQPEDGVKIERVFEEWLGERIAAAGLRGRG